MSNAKDDVGAGATIGESGAPNGGRTGDAPEWLRAFCASPHSLVASKLSEPFTFVRSGQRLSCATDGHRLAVLSADLGLPEQGPDISPLLTELRGGLPFDVARFRAFLAPVFPDPPVACEACNAEGLVECDECDGEGTTECECDCGNEHEAVCEACSGSGGVACGKCAQPSRVGLFRIGRRFFNAALFDSLPPMFDTEPVTFYASGEPFKPIHLASASCRMVVMPMRADGRELVPESSLDSDSPATASGSPATGAPSPSTDTRNPVSSPEKESDGGTT